MESLVIRILNVGIIPILLLLLSFFSKKYIVPLLKTEFRRSLARYVLLIADEITDWLVMKYPEKKWTEWLDEAVDKLMEITGVSKGVAERAIKASIARKNGL
ncbi:MAG: hypothetical protein ACPL6C_03545 [bacterium]